VAELSSLLSKILGALNQRSLHHVAQVIDGGRAERNARRLDAAVRQAATA